MLYSQLGNTGTFVSRLCFGTMTFGGAGTIYQAIGGLGQENANALVSQSLDAGVNFFDTANVYALGESETMLGKALGAKRKEVVVATKTYGRMGSGANDVGLSRIQILRSAEDSLKRLGTDYIDLYQIHGFDPLTPMEETLSALTDLVRQGKVRYIGCSNLAAWHIVKALGISAREHLEKFVTLQAYYSLAGRDLEREIVPMLLDQKVGLLIWSPLAGGFLSGKFTRGGVSEEDSRRSKFGFPPVNLEKTYDIIDAMQTMAKEKQATVAQIALAWLLHQPAVTSVIIGAKKPDQLKDNLSSIDVKLEAADLEKLDKLSELAPEYPGWMFSFQGSDRRPGQVRDWSRVTPK
ncbi:MAG TPA: aldo/keto reductase [Bryobacteraceae bacterium]|jgi:aryl-alcohol dehydrogenase-like predicted oxidoreductase|nr:aldo/keto reductase [Bryobacteraceae bacterium]